MKRQTSGCIRQVCSRKRPRSAGPCLRFAEQVLEHREPARPRVGALRDLRELLRVAEQDDVARRGAERERVGERDLAGLVDEEVSTTPSMSSREKSQAVPASERRRRGR